MSKRKAISLINNSNLIEKMGILSIFFIIIHKMSITTYYERNKDVIVNRAKEYYKNDKERLREKARDKYRNLSEKEKKKTREHRK